MASTPKIRLFPCPRFVDLGGPGIRDATGEVVPFHDPELPSEGYRLRVSPEGIELGFADGNGRRYGEATLSQLRL